MENWLFHAIGETGNFNYMYYVNLWYLLIVCETVCPMHWVYSRRGNSVSEIH